MHEHRCLITEIRFHQSNGDYPGLRVCTGLIVSGSSEQILKYDFERSNNLEKPLKAQVITRGQVVELKPGSSRLIAGGGPGRKMFGCKKAAELSRRLPGRPSWAKTGAFMPLCGERWGSSLALRRDPVSRWELQHECGSCSTFSQKENVWMQ